MISTPVKVGIIDLYNKEVNQGMRCILDILNSFDGKVNGVQVDYRHYDLRADGEIPGMEYDIYISSGGPGSPFDGEGSEWEKDYFNLLDNIMSHNQNNESGKKYVFFICHSFQMMVRYFKLADIVERQNRAFGIFPIYKTPEGREDAIFKSLPDPFYGADFREWQVLNPDRKVFDELGAELLCIERVRERYPDPSQRALMAIRISNEIVGTQFHPEADPESMVFHFKDPERKKQVIDEFDERTYYDMINHLENPDNITLTHNTVLPRFLTNAIDELRFHESFV